MKHPKTKQRKESKEKEATRQKTESTKRRASLTKSSPMHHKTKRTRCEATLPANNPLHHKILNAFLCIILMSSCASMKHSILTGAGTGATAGMYVGAKSVRTGKKKNAAITAAVGAALGGLAGYFTHGRLEKRDEKNTTGCAFKSRKVRDRLGRKRTAGMFYQ